MNQPRPLLAVTMGDPAGIGPEIAVRALLSDDVCAVSRSFAIGDARVLERALAVCGLAAPLHRIAGPEDIADRPGVIDVLHQDSADPARLQIGEVQALGGTAGYAAIRASIELAMAGRVAGVVTGPINKESLKAAGIPFIGHTEMFADQTGAREEMTMFTIRGLKIFFLTRHVSLLEACRLISTERVAKGIERSLRALGQLGIEAPHLAVAALNPHGGEDGLFGREEIEAIKPAIAAARARGMRVSGPVPADSVFHMARIGRYDAVLSLYHDQGHIAAKMLDFERTVSVTLGLPILRTSVDHGTAFDIAGTGKASAVSLIEAIRVAADYAVRGVQLGPPVAEAAG
ncbi:MAG TPA: 4-hydroxythreonine-4-phosphate dehydrogenase PdxA [Acetobacteraceae bacterium]|nr:4-hydroxythreonine-4-phosphate dehydrogenase PdxA [Acetobacteraceae bacterium]